jgi:hypothetical protein
MQGFPMRQLLLSLGRGVCSGGDDVSFTLGTEMKHTAPAGSVPPSA